MHKFVHSVCVHEDLLRMLYGYNRQNQYWDVRLPVVETKADLPTDTRNVEPTTSTVFGESRGTSLGGSWILCASNAQTRWIDPHHMKWYV